MKLIQVYSKIRLNEVVKTNVEPPKFGLNYYLTTIPEGWSNPDKPIFTARGSFWQPNSLRYKLSESKISTFFRIDENTGELCLISPLDREISDKVNINILGKLISSEVISKNEVPVKFLDHVVHIISPLSLSLGTPKSFKLKP